MRRILKVLLFCLAFLILLFAIAELTLRLIVGVKPDFATATMHSLQSDSILGWANKPYLNTSSTIEDPNIHSITVTTDRNGDRITSFTDTLHHPDLSPAIHLYGCSYTFGVAVGDTSTFAYKLQSKLPQYKVVNKGVSAYGLSQMLGSLKQSLIHGDTPQIAIFNYSNFHDMRTGLSKQWTTMLWWGIQLSDDPRAYAKNKLSYFDLDHGRLVTRDMKFSDFSHSWPLADRSAVIFLLNNLYINNHDDKLTPYLHDISYRSLLQIIAYCQANNIIPVIGYMRFDNPEMVAIPHDMDDSLAQHGVYLVDYSIDIAERKWNCFPADQGHPNGNAHTVYANEIYNYLTEKRLVHIISTDKQEAY